MPSVHLAPRRAVLPVLVAAAIGLAGCSGSSSSSGSSGGGGGKALVIDTSFNLKTVDPGRMFEETGLLVDRALYDTLLTFNGSDVSKPVPALAQSYTVSPDGKTLTLKLRQGATFSDGSPVTADDVVFSLNRVAGLKGNPSFLLAGVTVKKVDASTITLVSQKPNPALPFILPNPALGIVNSKVVQAHGGSETTSDKAETFLNTQSAGSGPYELNSFNASTQVVLTANPKYWGATKPTYKKIVIRNVQSSTQQLDVQRGDSQIALDLSADQAQHIGGNLQVLKGASANVFFLLSNADPAVSKITSNPNFVQAVRKGVDYQGLLQLAGEGSVQPAGIVPSMINGSLPASQAAHRDVAGAKAALAASGLGHPSVTLEYPSDYTLNGLPFQPLAERIQSNLKDVGITVNLSPGPIATALQNYRNGKEQMGLWWWSPDYPDASDYLSFLPGSLIGLRAGWKAGASPALESAGVKAATTISDADRTTQYQAIQTQLNQISPFVPLIQPSQHVVAASSVTGLAINPVWTIDVASLGSK